MPECSLWSFNAFTYETTFTKLHNQRANIVFGFFMQSIIRNEYHVSFVSIDILKPHPEMSFHFLPDHVEIVASINQWALLCHIYHEPWYYVDNLTTKQWQYIPIPKTQYDIIEFGVMIARSKPLHYKIMWFLKPKFHPHDNEFYIWGKVSTRGVPYSNDKSIREWFTSLVYLEKKHICIWCENEELFLVSTFSTSLWGNDSKDIGLVKYEGKLVMMCIDRESDFIKVWIIEKYNKRQWESRKSRAVKREKLPIVLREMICVLQAVSVFFLYCAPFFFSCHLLLSFLSSVYYDKIKEQIFHSSFHPGQFLASN